MENEKQILSKVKGTNKLHTDEELTPEVLRRFPGCEFDLFFLDPLNIGESLKTPLLLVHSDQHDLILFQ
jgi:hypothetical protein